MAGIDGDSRFTCVDFHHCARSDAASTAKLSRMVERWHGHAQPSNGRVDDYEHDRLRFRALEGPQNTQIHDLTASTTPPEP
jgi:hypothetical protein